MNRIGRKIAFFWSMFTSMAAYLALLFKLKILFFIPEGMSVTQAYALSGVPVAGAYIIAIIALIVVIMMLAHSIKILRPYE